MLLKGGLVLRYGRNTYCDRRECLPDLKTGSSVRPFAPGKERLPLEGRQCRFYRDGDFHRTCAAALEREFAAGRIYRSGKNSPGMRHSCMITF